MSGKTKSVIILFLLMQAVILLALRPEITRHADGSWREFRAEGLSLAEALPYAPSYVRKYLFKSSAAPDSIRKMETGQEKIWHDSIDLSDSESVIRIAFTGDIMWIRNNWNSFADPGLIERLSRFDMVFGNLETPIDPFSEVKSLLPDYVKYNSPPGLLRSFRRADGSSIFTAVSLANNHASDMGPDGLNRTIQFLEKEGIGHHGAVSGGHRKEDFLVLESDGIKVGFHAAGWGLNDPMAIKRGEIDMNLLPGIAPQGSEMPDASGIKRVLNRMDSAGVDIKIIFLHWGYEFELFPDKTTVSLAREIAEAGADLIIGSHPHVIQPVEVWPSSGVDPDRQAHRSLIAYSLGNFTTAMYTEACRTGMVLPVTLFRKRPGERAEWVAHSPFRVINVPAGVAGRKRRLMLQSDYTSDK